MADRYNQMQSPNDSEEEAYVKNMKKAKRSKQASTDEIDLLGKRTSRLEKQALLAQEGDCTQLNLIKQSIHSLTEMVTKKHMKLQVEVITYEKLITDFTNK